MPGSIKIDDGSGNYTILTNAGSLGSDKTITIPNSTGTLATTTDVNNVTPGITMADQWRITANATMGSMAYLTANWERNDSTGDGVPFGTGLTESSGQFTFPSTGIYLIHITNTSQAAASFANRYALNVTTDNFSSSDDVCWAYSRNGNASGSTTLQQTSSNSYIFDVTDTSTHKFRINAGVLTAGGTTTLLGSTTIQHTGFSVFRIGDT